MAQSRIKTLQNITSVPQKVVFDDRIEIIPPYATRDLLDDLARVFLEKRPGLVVEYTATSIPATSPGEESVWVANVTGNPFVDKKVVEKVVRKGEETLIELDNPLRDPVVMTYWMSQGQTIQPAERDPMTTASVNHPKRLIRIPPYQRVFCGRITADWLMRRDSQALKHHQGKIIICDPPTSYEPNDSWPLDEIRYYAEYVDEATFSRKSLFWGDVLGPTEEELKGDVGAVTAAKIDLLHKLFFRLVDPRYAKPSRSEMEVYRKTKTNRGVAPPVGRPK